MLEEYPSECASSIYGASQDDSTTLGDSTRSHDRAYGSVAGWVVCETDVAFDKIQP